MKNYFAQFLLLVITLMCFVACNSVSYDKGTFGSDLEFLKEKSNPIVLADNNKQIVVSAEYQGRVLTSTSKGLKGLSYGWFNKDIINSGTSNENISKIGGESRIWFGPDIGPNSVFFDPLKSEEEREIEAQKDLNTLPFKILEEAKTSTKFGGQLNLENLKGFKFKIDVIRDISLLNNENINKALNLELPNTASVIGYNVTTSMKNIGNENWSKETGLLSVWDLGCYHPTPRTRVIIPTKGALEEATVYFSELDSTRIQIKNNVLYYKADGAYLNKIGVKPEYTLPFFGSYSPELNLLTIIKFTFDGDTSYVNSHPVHIENQYAGDVTNVFNDGVIGDIGPFGPFYELETSSKAKELLVGETITHSQEVYHVEANKENIDGILKAVFGISIAEVETALP